MYCLLTCSTKYRQLVKYMNCDLTNDKTQGAKLDKWRRGKNWSKQASNKLRKAVINHLVYIMSKYLASHISLQYLIFHCHTIWSKCIYELKILTLEMKTQHTLSFVQMFLFFYCEFAHLACIVLI